MKYLNFTLLFFFAGLSVALSNGNLPHIISGPSDSAYYARLLGEPIFKCHTAYDSSVWVIAGTNHNKLFRINNKGEAEHIPDKYPFPGDVCFTDVLGVSPSGTLIGTSKHYIFYLRNKKMLWLNSQYGLTDSTIAAFDYNKELELLLVTTTHTRFLMKNPNKLRNIRFVEIKDTQSTFDEMVHYIKENFQKPFQKKVLNIISDVDFSFRKVKYLNSEELNRIKTLIQPGDIILRRNELYLTNIGIPGFWTHSGIFTGDSAIMNTFFAGLPMLGGQSPATYLDENYPEIFNIIANTPHAVIEAISKGVVIEPIEHIANADYLVVLRTNLPREDLFKSLLTAFEYLHASYDFLFDFSNDNELVCSELVYHALRPHHDKKGVNFVFGSVDGKPFISPNDIAKQYCRENKSTAKQLTMIYYFDAAFHLKKKKPSENDFCKTWKKKQ